jgi:DNA-binding MarR family transcriptional regulator
MAPARQSRPTDNSLAAVVSHPLRNRCLTILNERTASPSELAEELGKEVSNVAYHVNRLVEMGQVEAVGTRPVRGAVEHFYKAVQRPLLDVNHHLTLTVEQRTEIARYVAQLSIADLSTSIEAGTFAERPDHHVTRLPVLVDEEGWQKLQELYLNAFEQAFEIEAESAQRMSADPEIPAIRARILSFVFEMPEQLGPPRRSFSRPPARSEQPVEPTP